MTDEAQRRPVTVEQMRQRRDAWRVRYDAEHAKYVVEREKARRLERALETADATWESLETLRRQYRLVHQYWHDVRVENIRLRTEVRQLTEDLDRRHGNFRLMSKESRALRTKVVEQETTIQRRDEEITRLRALIADELGELGRELERNQSGCADGKMGPQEH